MAGVQKFKRIMEFEARQYSLHNSPMHKCVKQISCYYIHYKHVIK